jgi:hypothetical protein
MGQPYAKKRQAALRRDKSKLENYGAKLFHEVKRFDGEGNLIETISPDELMAQPIGSSTYSGGKGGSNGRRCYNRRLGRSNGEGSQGAWDKAVSKVSNGARPPYHKVKV